MRDGNHTGTTAAAPVSDAISRVFAVCRGVFWQSHLTNVRMLLALASLGWALAIITNPDVLHIYPYQYMPLVMPTWLWVALFAAHFVGTFWRIFDGTSRLRWALAVNTLGCFLWITLTICVNLRAGHFIPGSCLEVVTCCFSAWALVRTGLGKDVGTP
jgi:hypothetical protein